MNYAAIHLPIASEMAHEVPRRFSRAVDLRKSNVPFGGKPKMPVSGGWKVRRSDGD
jgi:hypothetical protein